VNSRFSLLQFHLRTLFIISQFTLSIIDLSDDESEEEGAEMRVKKRLMMMSMK
jgi:hypothetical protein